MNKFFVISHTHWDREWYMTFEQFRIKLVDLMDHLLTIIENQPDYVFNLDAQTIVLEDYLEIKPSKRPLIEKYIKSGRIITGPWYLQNDFNLTSGESTIRNLQKGIQMATSFGACQRVGYAPDQFGHISQIPQIMNGFDIDNYVFGRGYKHFVKKDDYYEIKDMPTEFTLEGPDGSSVLAIYLKEWYNNGQRFSTDLDKVKKQLQINIEKFEKHNITPYILMMNGVDHLEPQANVLDIIQDLKKQGFQIEQVSFENYLDEVKKYIKDHNLQPEVYRDILNKGDDYSLLRGTWSSRILQKRMNVRAQDALESQIEPLLTVLENAGFKGVYDFDYVQFMWKLLLKNHPHDSICGCSKDAVHAHIENRYSELKEITDGYIKKTMELASAYGYKTNKENYTITVFNSIDLPRAGVVELKFEFIKKENVKGFDILTRNKEKLNYIILDHYQDIKDVTSPVNLPGVLDVDVYHILLETPVIKPFQFYQYIIVPHHDDAIDMKQVNEPKHNIENEYYTLEVIDRKVQMTDKNRNFISTDFISLVDEVDRGDTYVFEPTTDEKRIAILKDYEIIKYQDFKQSMILSYLLESPSHYDFDKLTPAKDCLKTEITVTITLDKSEVIDISYVFNNQKKDHRMRLVVDTGITKEGLLADSPFDVLFYKKEDASPVAKSKTFCNSTFVAKQDHYTCAVYTEGQHEVEELDNMIALTILRSTGYIARVENFVPCAGDLFSAPENQLLRRIEGRVGVQFIDGKPHEATIYTYAKAHRNPLLTFFNSANPHKFLGGRFAVQDSSIAELFYLDDAYPENSIFNTRDFKLDNKHIAVSSYRVNEKNHTILRLVNLSNERQISSINLNGQLYETNMMEEKEQQVSKTLEFRPKEIKTLRISYE